MGATATYQLDTERDKDAQAIFERSQKIQEVNHTSKCADIDLAKGDSVYCLTIFLMIASG